MRGWSVLLAALAVVGCAGDDADSTPAPIGERFWWSGGGSEGGAQIGEMFRSDERVELRVDWTTVAVGSLTSDGLAAWDTAVASIDPDVDLYTCGFVDGIDACVDIEHPSAGPLELCYCVGEPVQAEIAEFDAFVSGLAVALLDCESSEHIVVDDCR